VGSGQLLPQPAALLSLLQADENHGGNIHAAVSFQTRDPEAYKPQVYLVVEVAAREPDQTLVATGNPEGSLVGAVCRNRTPTVEAPSCFAMSSAWSAGRASKPSTRRICRRNEWGFASSAASGIRADAWAVLRTGAGARTEASKRQRRGFSLTGSSVPARLCDRRAGPAGVLRLDGSGCGMTPTERGAKLQAAPSGPGSAAVAVAACWGGREAVVRATVTAALLP
jgi:hypothetical protein